MVVEVKRSDNGNVALEYYVEGLGRVKTEQESPSRVQNEHLVSVTDAPLQEQLAMIYSWYAEEQADEEGGLHYFMKPLYDMKTVTYSTNSDIYALYSELLRSYALEKFGFGLGDEVKINSLEIDRFNGSLNIDVSQGFLDAMNESPESERTYLKFVANTLGEIYSAFYVTLTVEGEAYVSGNVTIDPAAGDYIELGRYKNGEAFHYSEALRGYASENFGLELDDDAEINYLQADPDRGLLLIDMSKAFIEAMNGSPENETPILQYLADTLGEIYSASYVAFSVEGGAYVSDNLTMDPAAGDYLEPSVNKGAGN
jgi:hypothetical protein